MGLTHHSLSLLEKYAVPSNCKRVLEFGAQNAYCLPHSGDKKPPYADIIYKDLGFDLYVSIDLNGENDSYKIDLGSENALDILKQNVPNAIFDLVSDFGCSEHININGLHSIEALYNCWKLKHDAVKVGGIIISENPKTGNWGGHGFAYYTEEWANKLGELCGYEILEVGEFPAEHNTIDGWNIFSVYKKVSDTPFISVDEFRCCEIKLS